MKNKYEDMVICNFFSPAIDIKYWYAISKHASTLSYEQLYGRHEYKRDTAFNQCIFYFIQDKYRYNQFRYFIKSMEE